MFLQGVIRELNSHLDRRIYVLLELEIMIAQVMIIYLEIISEDKLPENKLKGNTEHV
jgi:hypothetical protein